MNPEFGDIKEFLNKDAIILDVRTTEEFNAGHVQGAMHIVLDQLENDIDQLKTIKKPVITCCRSGARSERAKDYLVSQGIEAINGGPWQNVNAHL